MEEVVFEQDVEGYARFALEKGTPCGGKSVDRDTEAEQKAM